jgi:23S rRNA pseudouridine1911/1915/1917 synthase
MTNFTVEPNDRITFKIRYEDEHLAIVDKPAGVPTQPGLAHLDDTLLNGLFARWGRRLQNLGKDRDFGLLHRLDRYASGVLVVGLTVQAYDTLREAFASRALAKFYWAIVKGAPNSPKGVIDKPIAESIRGKDSDIKRAKISAKGKPSITAFRVIETGVGASVVECRPITGRLHQVRVHMDLIGCPILGDDIYGSEAVAAAASRLALHAHRLVLAHPVTGDSIDVRSPFPRDLRRTLARFSLHAPASEASSAETPARLADEQEA